MFSLDVKLEYWYVLLEYQVEMLICSPLLSSWNTDMFSLGVKLKCWHVLLGCQVGILIYSPWMSSWNSDMFYLDVKLEFGYVLFWCQVGILVCSIWMSRWNTHMFMMSSFNPFMHNFWKWPTYFKNPAIRTPEDFWNIFGHFSTLYRKGLNRKCWMGCRSNRPDGFLLKGLEAFDFIEERLRHTRFPVNFANF